MIGGNTGLVMSGMSTPIANDLLRFNDDAEMFGK